jgi:hypothetical protein
VKPELWDLVGLGGFGVLCGGVYQLVGGAWVAVLVGVVLTAIYAARELQLVARPKERE